MSKRPQAAAVGKNASALKKLKASLKTAGVIGVNKPKKRVLKQQTPQNGKPTRGQQIQSALTKMKNSSANAGANPFELKVTKLKHDVLGRTVKGAQGRPAIARTKSVNARKQGLLSDIAQRNKTGSFIDKRIGENDPTLTPEDKMMMRWTREKQRISAARSGAFNLDSDNEELNSLTHLGRSVNDLDDFDDLMPSDEDVEDTGTLDRNFVSQGHFGGFDGEHDNRDPNRHKSKSEVMKELIAKSKMYKAERQKVREENEDLRLELDADLAAINHLLVNTNGASTHRPDKTASNTTLNSMGDKDNLYDQFVRELQFERRAQPTDRLKTEEETIAEEKSKLEQLENARRKRMLGLSDSEEEDGKNDNRKKRRRRQQSQPSADDLDDDYYEDRETQLDSDDGDDDGERKLKSRADTMPLTYHNGILVNTTITLKPKGSKKQDVEKVKENESEDSDESEEDNDDEEEDDDDESQELIDALVSDAEDIDIVSEAEVAMKDLNEYDSDDSDAYDENDKNNSLSTKELPQVQEKKRISMQQASSELPYTFPAPETHADLLKLVNNRSTIEILTLVRRLHVLYHPQLAKGNKFKLESSFLALLEHITFLDESFNTTDKEVLAYCTALFPEFITLAKQFPIPLANYATQVLHKYAHDLKQQLVNTMSTQELDSNSPSLYPSVGQLLHFKLFGQVFSTSDYFHVVATPMMLLMCQWLSICPVRSIRDMNRGVFLCSLFAEFQALSKRLVPEVHNFLCNMLISVHQNLPNATMGIFPRTNIFPEIKLPSLSSIEPEKLSLGFSTSTANDLSPSSVVNLVYAGILLLGRYEKYYQSLPNYAELFTPVLSILSAFTVHPMHERVTIAIDDLKQSITTSLAMAVLKRRPLRLRSYKPVALPSIAPAFVDRYSIDRKDSATMEEQETAKLKYQLKKERKGALRELKKDAHFLANERTKQQKAKDAGYNEKMRRVEGQLGDEVGELKKLVRENERMKRRK